MVQFCSAEDTPKNIPSYLKLDSFNDLGDLQMSDFQFLIATQITVSEETGHRDSLGSRILRYKPAFGIVLAKDEQGVADWVQYRATNKFSPITYHITRLNLVQAVINVTVK